MKTWVKKIMLEKIMVFMFGADEVDTNFWGFWTFDDTLFIGIDKRFHRMEEI